MSDKRNLTLIFGMIITAAIITAVIISFFWTPYPPGEQSAALRLSAPSALHIMGTDNLGRDIFSRVLAGAGTTLFIAAATVFIGAVIGGVIGAMTGYFGGPLDTALMRINDTITAFPGILLALVLISLLGPGKYNVILALGLLFIPSFARIVRGEFARIKNLDYITNARLMGTKTPRILLRHILPNTLTTLLSALAIGFNNAVLAEAGMSYLGIGVLPPEPSLGRMLSESQNNLFKAPWYAVFVGCAIALMILGFSLLGDGLRNKR